MTPDDPLFLAIDGGASRTRMGLYDADGGVLHSCHVGPTSLTLEGAAAWSVIQKGLEALRSRLGLEQGWLARCRIGAGLAGVNDDIRRQAFIAATPACAGLALASDAYIAALGAHAGTPGAIVIAGTGSVGYRIFEGGRGLMVGGWGFPIDDAGSGAWIGRRALSRALHVVDGRRGAAELSPCEQEMLSYAGGQRAAILDWLHGASSTKYAELAPIVLDHATKCEAAACNLAREAGQEIRAMALALDPTGSVRLSLLGGLAEPLGPFLPEDLAAWVQPALGDALAGALLLARGEAPAESFVTGIDLRASGET